MACRLRQQWRHPPKPSPCRKPPHTLDAWASITRGPWQVLRPQRKVPWLFAAKNNDHLKLHKGYTAGLYITSSHVFPTDEDGHPTTLTTEYQLHGRKDKCGGNLVTVPTDYQDLFVYVDKDNWMLAPIWTISGFNVS